MTSDNTTFDLCWNLLSSCSVENRPAGGGEVQRVCGEAKGLRGAGQTDPAFHEGGGGVQGQGDLQTVPTQSAFTCPGSPDLWTLLSQQEEQYNHLDELEVTRVDKQLNDAMVWMNGKMNQQNGQDLTLEPVVRVAEIQAKTKVKREGERDWKKKISCCTQRLSNRALREQAANTELNFPFSVFLKSTGVFWAVSGVI